MTATRWVKCVKYVNNEERLKALKGQSLEKRWIRNDFVLAHKILYNQMDLEVTQLFKHSGQHCEFFNKLGQPEDEETG